MPPSSPRSDRQEEEHKGFRWSIRHVIFLVTVLPVLVCIIILVVIGAFSGAWVRQETISAVTLSLNEQLTEEMTLIFESSIIETARSLSMMVLANLSLTQVRAQANTGGSLGQRICAGTRAGGFRRELGPADLRGHLGQRIWAPRPEPACLARIWGPLRPTMRARTPVIGHLDCAH